MTETMRIVDLETLRDLAIADCKRRKAETMKSNLLRVARKLSAIAVVVALGSTIAMGISADKNKNAETDNKTQAGETEKTNDSKAASNYVEKYVELSNISYDLEAVDVVLPEEETSTEWSATSNYSLSDWEIDLLVRAVQHETGSNPDFYPNGDFDTVQQYMAASILNRVGQPGFGTDYTTAYSVYEVLANPVQYGSLLWEIDSFDPYDYRTRQNVLAVINGQTWIPDHLYFERCSYVGEDYWSAQDSFYAQYGYNPNINIAYMSLTQEGRYIIFATNPGGAY